MVTSTAPTAPQSERPARPIKLTVRLGEPDELALYRALRHAAVELGQTQQAIVLEALRRWLEAYEAQADLAAMAEVEQEPAVPWEEVKTVLRARRPVEAGTRAGQHDR